MSQNFRHFCPLPLSELFYYYIPSSRKKCFLFYFCRLQFFFFFFYNWSNATLFRLYICSSHFLCFISKCMIVNVQLIEEFSLYSTWTTLVWERWLDRSNPSTLAQHCIVLSILAENQKHVLQLFRNCPQLCFWTLPNVFWTVSIECSVTNSLVRRRRENLRNFMP